MRGVVESWDQNRGRGWIRPVAEPERALRVPADSRIEVERGVLSPSVREGLRPGQQVGFIYRAPATPELPARAECVVVISDPQAMKTAAEKVKTR
jgi:hypothetical protein